MLAKDKEDFVDTICSISDSNGGGGDSSDIIKYYKVKEGVINLRENTNLSFMIYAPIINASYTYEVNSGRDLNPKVTSYIIIQAQNPPVNAYIKAVMDTYLKDQTKEGFYIEGLLNDQGLTFEDIGLIPCTKEEFYDISWNPDDFQ